MIKISHFKGRAMIAGLVLSVSNAFAGTIDLIGLGGNFDQSTFGASGSEYYSQSVVANDYLWEGLSFGVSDSEGGSFNLIISGARTSTLDALGYSPDATSVLYQATLNHSGGGLEFFDVLLNLSVDTGTTYFFNLQGFNGTLSGATVRATEYNGTDKYQAGTFMYSNDGSAFSNNLSWSSRYGNGEDLAFSAAFVPVPAAVWLFGSALAGLGWVRRRKAV